MQQLVNCPFCNDVMLAQDQPQPGGRSCTFKSCTKHPSHQIKSISADETNEIVKLTILVSFDPTIWVTWHYLSEEIRVHNYSKPFSKMIGDPLPWFEPDLSDCSKLIDKVRTYIIFS